MKRLMNMAMILVIMLLLCACGAKVETPTWQEQYDLGVCYLLEGNYEDAVIAFTAAIEIDAKRVEAYMGRGDAYAGMAETMLGSAEADSELSQEARELLEKAVDDYLAVIELDETLSDAYGKAAQIYSHLGDDEAAIALLERNADITGDERWRDLLDELKSKSQQLPPKEAIPPLADAMTDLTDSTENSGSEIASAESEEKPDALLPETAEPIITDEENTGNAQAENAASNEEENELKVIEQPEPATEEADDTMLMQPEEGTLIISAGESYEIDVSDKNCVLEYLGDNATIEVFDLWYDTVLKNYEGSAKISTDNSATTGEKQTWSAAGFANNRLIKKHITVTSGKIKIWHINQPNVSIKKADHSALTHWHLMAGDSVTLTVANPYGYKGTEYYLHCNTADKYTAHMVVYSKSGEVKNDYTSNEKFYRPMHQGEKIEITMEEGSAHFYAGYRCLIEN